MDFLIGRVTSGIFHEANEAVSIIGGIGQVINVGGDKGYGDDHIQMALAPSYGSLDNEAIRRMDDNTKVMIGTTITMLESMSPNERTWNNVIAAMKSNSLLEPINENGSHRSDQLTKSGSSDFNLNESPDQGTINEIVTWFTNLIADDDIIRTMKVDIQELARLVARTGASVDGVDSLFFKAENHQKNVLDIGAIRYPDLSNPHFKIYRIQVNAWSHSSRVLFHQEDSNGIRGDFNCWQFRPRPERIADLKEEVRALAIETAENLFN